MSIALVSVEVLSSCMGLVAAILEARVLNKISLTKTEVGEGLCSPALYIWQYPPPATTLFNNMVKEMPSCGVLNGKAPPLHSLGIWTLDPQLVALFRDVQEVQPCWRKYITRSIPLPISSLCFLLAEMMWDLSFLFQLPCLSLWRTHPSRRVNQIKLSF